MSSKQQIGDSELIINPDGSIYHLHLKPGQVAETIFTVGDPARVLEISKYFDRIEHKVQYREFLTHTGYMNNKRFTVISTGIGPDNIDIAVNELDALFNIDFTTRTIKDTLTPLNIIRVGTCGCVNEEIGLDEIIISEVGIGMDGVMNYYDLPNSAKETEYIDAFTNYMKPHFSEIKPYIASGSEVLLKKFEKYYKKVSSITANGFYGAQGRTLRAKNEIDNYVEILNKFRHQNFRISNFEMETAAIYGFGKMLGHHCLSINVIVAQRIQKKFSSDPKKAVEKMIAQVMEQVAN